MGTQGINLFIVDDNRLVVKDLQLSLLNRFGVTIQISTFNDGESCLEKIDKKTQIVILDYYFLGGKNGLEILKSIKALNPKTEVIMFSGNKDKALAIETFRAGAKDFVVKGQDSWKKISKLVLHYIITTRIRIIVRGFGILC